ncbi:hypothetical protein AtNW77_Chr5g0131221 [Arabidopsis thaliana]|nr:Bax inhibitor 1-related [Arabidopsis thaliana x Arabidopsis arenosa]KAG7611868.1 Bax inhibitor 1-related [Arabidopsis suecica]
MDGLKDFSRISPAIQSHLMRVYFSLFCILAASAFGAYLHMRLNIGGTITKLGWVLSLLEHVVSCPPYKHKIRFSLLLLFGVLHGASAGPCIKSTIDIDSSILITAFLGTAVIFFWFSAVAMLARRREYIYLGGLLPSGFSLLAWLKNSDQFASSTVEIQMYLGLLLFVGCIVVKTQEIIEKAHSGDMDYAVHSLILFIGFVRVFLQILSIMWNNSADRIRRNNEET